MTISKFDIVGSILNLPVFMGVISNSANKNNDKYSDATFMIEDDSGMLFISENIPNKILYQRQTTQAPIGELWKNHHEEFSSFIVQKNNNSNILEVGAAHGYLATCTTKKNKSLNWTIVEPNPVKEKPEGIRYIDGYLTNEILNSINPRTIVHSHVIEHIDNLLDFMQLISNFQKSGDNLIFSVPHLDKWFAKGFPNALNFEHRFLIDSDYIEELHENYGYELKSFIDFKRDHSRFYHFEKKYSKNEKLIFKTKDQRKKSSYEKFKLFTSNMQKTILEAQNTFKQNPKSKVAIFGASVISQMLFCFGLNESNINCVLDNDKLKHNQRLYGTNLFVRNPYILREGSWIVIVKMGSHTEDVVKQIKKLNSSLKIIF